MSGLALTNSYIAVESCDRPRVKSGEANVCASSMMRDEAVSGGDFLNSSLVITVAYGASFCHDFLSCLGQTTIQGSRLEPQMDAGKVLPVLISQHRRALLGFVSTMRC